MTFCTLIKSGFSCISSFEILIWVPLNSLSFGAIRFEILRGGRKSSDDPSLFFLFFFTDPFTHQWKCTRVLEGPHPTFYFSGTHFPTCAFFLADPSSHIFILGFPELSPSPLRISNGIAFDISVLILWTTLNMCLLFTNKHKIKHVVHILPLLTIDI